MDLFIQDQKNLVMKTFIQANIDSPDFRLNIVLTSVVYLNAESKGIKFSKQVSLGSFIQVSISMALFSWCRKEIGELSIIKTFERSEFTLLRSFVKPYIVRR